MRTGLIVLFVMFGCSCAYADLPTVPKIRNIPNPPPVVTCVAPSDQDVGDALVRVTQALEASERAQADGVPDEEREALLYETTAAIEYMLGLMIQVALGGCSPS